MAMNLESKVAIVTGGGSGIGRAMSLGLAAAGAAVCVADVAIGGAEETAAMIAEKGGRGMAVQVDVTDRASIRRMVEAVVQRFCKVNVLLNNAGVANRDLILDLSEAEFDRVIGVNLKGPLLCTQEVVPHMRVAGGGSIINTISSSCELINPRLAVYGSSKGALKVLTKAMAVEFAQYNIRANGIVPHTTITGLNRTRITPEVEEREVARIPLGRLAKPEDYVGVAVLLASDESAWMTGSMVWVDGGFSSAAVMPPKTA